MTAHDPSSEVARLLSETAGVLLDFNGTLSDDEDLLAGLLAELAFEELGIALGPERYYAEFVGQTEEHMFRTLVTERGTIADPAEVHRLVGALVSKFNRRYLDRVSVDRRIPEAAEAFVREARARGKSIAVVTAASKDIVVPTLNRLDLLEPIDAVVALEDVEHSKPEPDCYLRALDLLGLSPEQALVFEDSRTGLSSAGAAGIRTVAVGDALSDAEREAFTPYAVPALHPTLFREAGAAIRAVR